MNRKRVLRYRFKTHGIVLVFILLLKSIRFSRAEVHSPAPYSEE